MRDPSRAPVPMLLTPALQHYAWGDPRIIPELLGLGSSREPCAEAWFGAHPQASARARLADTEQPLDALVQAHPTWFHTQGVEAHSGEMPYLLKLLAAEKPLSIQVHPNRAQARAGFAREEHAGIARDAAQRCYRDRNHKPELIVALTPFHALCGFRPPEQIHSRMRELPELQVLLPPFRPNSAGIRALLESYHALPDAQLQPALRQVLA